MPHRYYVYILANRKRSVLYTGMTNDLRRRLNEHRMGKGSAFTRRYNVHDLVYAESFSHVNEAIAREKQIKAGSRARKDRLIESINPSWDDLTDDMMFLD